MIHTDRSDLQTDRDRGDRCTSGNVKQGCLADLLCWHRERERERETQRDKETETERERQRERDKETEADGDSSSPTPPSLDSLYVLRGRQAASQQTNQVYHVLG